MSITRDFEKKEIPEAVCGYFESDVLELLAHARSIEAQNEELKAMLRKHECIIDSGAEFCPECDSWPHKPDCALAKLLG